MKKQKYKNGGDGMFFYHKKTKHPAKQLAHSDKTWTNKRYTHAPNRMNDYEIDEEYSTEDYPSYKTKKKHVDTIYTRGKPYNMNSYKKSANNDALR